MPIQPPSTKTIERFVDIVGSKYALCGEEEKAPYLREWRNKYVGQTALVLKPGSKEEVAAIVKLANETKTGLVPQGGNTGLVGGQIPFEEGSELVVSLERLNAIKKADPENNTMTVEAGVILKNIQTRADEIDRIFPLSLAAEGSCQIGGNLATNAGGVAVLAYGNARDLVLGLEVVLANGEIWNGLKTLRKDNTGYDLKNLFIGSEGTLGIITAAVLKLFPKPTAKATAFAGLNTLSDIGDFFNETARAAGPMLTGFEIIPRIGLEFVTTQIQNTKDPLTASYPWYVLVELSGYGENHNTDDQLQSILERALKENIIQDATLATSIEQAQHFWQLRESLSEAQTHEGGSIKHDISVPRAEISAFISEANDLVETMIPGARPVPFGHFGDGNIHYNISQPTNMDKETFLNHWDQLTTAIYGIVIRHGGSISAEHGIGQMKRDLLQQIKSPVEMDLLRKLKNSLDPNGILNPGKLL